MIAQQTTRYLFKLLSGDEQGPSSAYLRPEDSSPQAVQELRRERFQVRNKDELVNAPIGVEELISAFRHRAKRLAVETFQRLRRSVEHDGVAYSEAWNALLVDVNRVSRAHGFYITVVNFVQSLRELETKEKTAKPVLEVLWRLFRLYALSHVERDLGDFMEDSFLNATHASFVRSAVRRLESLLRHDAVALVDAFDFSDNSLNSALGCYDGDAYTHLWEFAQREPLNQQEVHPFFASGQRLKPQKNAVAAKL